MDLVAITDHDAIGGALALGDRNDVIAGCEVTAEFPGEPFCVHLNVLDITAAQHDEIQRRRRDVRDLLPYLRAQGVFTSLNHVASGVNGPITGAHVAALLPWVDAVEIRNGSRLPSQNRTAAGLATAYGKVELAGSDAHSPHAIGRTWVDAPAASTRGEFMRELRAGRVRVGGEHGGYFRLANDIVRAASGFYSDRFRMLLERPLSWHRHGVLLARACGAAGHRRPARAGRRPLRAGGAVQPGIALRPRRAARGPLAGGGLTEARPAARPGPCPRGCSVVPPSRRAILRLAGRPAGDPCGGVRGPHAGYGVCL